MPSQILRYTTRELSPETLPDFEKLLATHPGPGAFNCWCLYNQRAGPLPESERNLSSAKRNARNRAEKRERVENGCSHGIIVYGEGEPVGWCQFGPMAELPRIDNYAAYRKFAAEAEAKQVWRITCFVVARKHRGRGVASFALHAALEAIKKSGGGLVEAYPVARRGAYQDYRGNVSMFRREGFKVVGPLGQNNVLVRRTL